MTQRGRKGSKADLAVIDGSLGDRPSPPADLNDFEASKWAEVVGAMPPGWYSAEMAELLRGYCRHCYFIRLIDAEIDTAEKAKDIDQVCKLADKREKQMRAVTAIARSLRMTPQSTSDPKTAGRKKTATAKGAMPWDDD